MLEDFKNLKASIKSLCDNNLQMRELRLLDIEGHVVDVIIS